MFRVAVSRTRSVLRSGICRIRYSLLCGDDHENLAYSLDKHDDLYSYANIKVVIVKDGYRGHGLQQTFIRNFEEYAKTIGVKTLLSTVSPDNIYSCHNLEQCGFVSVKRLKKYGGKDRLLYLKDIAAQ